MRSPTYRDIVSAGTRPCTTRDTGRQGAGPCSEPSHSAGHGGCSGGPRVMSHLGPGAARGARAVYSNERAARSGAPTPYRVERDTGICGMVTAVVVS